MSDQLLFLLKLQDQVSPGMKAAASSTDNYANRMIRSMDSISQNTFKTTKAIGQLNSTIKSLDSDKFADKIVKGLHAAVLEARKLDRELDQVDRKANHKTTRGGGGAGLLGGLSIGRLGLYSAAAGAAYKAFDFAGDSIGSAMNMGKTQKSFEVLTGSVENGQKLVKDINALVKDTVLGPELFGNAQTMLAFGVSLDKVIPNLKMLGDVSMGDQERLNALTLAFSQVQAAGKLTGQDLLQFVNAGFNPLQEISKTTGISLSALRKQMEDGAISSDMVTKAFESATGAGGKFNNMLEQIAQTPAGKMAQLEGQFEAFKVKFGESMMPLAEVGIDGLNKLLDLANQALPYIVDGVTWLLATWNEILSPTGEWSDYVQTAQNIIWSIYDGTVYVGQKVWEIVTNFVEWIRNSQLMQDLFWGLGKLAEGVWWVIKKIADVIGWVYHNIIRPILDAIEWVYSKIKSILGLGDGKPIEIKGTVEDKTVTSTTAFPTPFRFGIDPTTANIPAPTPKAGAGAVQTLSKSAESINNGGQKQIIINIGKQIEKFELHSVNVREGISDLGSIVREELLRVLNSVNGIAVN